MLNNKISSIKKKMFYVVPDIVYKKIGKDLGIVNIIVSPDIKYITLNVSILETSLGYKYEYIIFIIKKNISKYIKFRFVPEIRIIYVENSAKEYFYCNNNFGSL